MARRLTAGIIAALVLGMGASSAAADTIYPRSPVNDFVDGTQSWADAGKRCFLKLGPVELPLPDLNSILPLACTVKNEHASSVGNPPGSISSSFTAVANIIGLINGEGSWQSPPFKVTTLGDAPVTGATFRMEHRPEIAGLIQAGGGATYTVTLVDDLPAPTADKVTVLHSQGLSASSGSFTPVNKVAPAGFLIKDHTYFLRINTVFTTSILQAALNPVNVWFDNIKLTVADGTDTGVVKAVATTLDPDNITDTSAVINGAVDAKGSPAFYEFEYGETTTYGSKTTRKDGGSESKPTLRSEPITGLKPCTTYHYRVRAANTINVATPASDASQDTLGGDISFTTDCKPTASTLPPAPIGQNAVTFNGTIVPNGPQTSYHYDWGPTTAYGNSTAERVAGSGRETKAPLSESVGNLTPNTTYHVRIVATNKLGTTFGEDREFKTLTPPAAGAPGTPGTPGAPGTPGRPGTPGPAGKPAPTNTTLQSGDERGLLVIRSPTGRVGLRGARAGQIRLPIFCRIETGRNCAGTVKIRTRGLINPSSIPGVRKKARRVTLATFEYQLQAGKVGYAISTIQPEKLRLMRRLKNVKVTFSVQVTDSNNNRQTIVRSGNFVAQNRV